MKSASFQNWPICLALLFASLVILIGIYGETAQSLVALWQSSETYAHGFIIFPISLYLIWLKRTELSLITPKPSASALIFLAVLELGWLLAQSAEVQVISQYMFVAMFSALIVTLLGWRLSRVIAFPLAFTLLAVPFGEIFIRPLIDFTANFTVAALQFSDIPVFREGSQFSLGSGNWSVVEACSGLRYLIASFTLGCLYAHLTYRSRLRQLIFILLSIIVPIIANGIRAYLIVILGHFSNMTIAVGIDHLIYGWLFFGFVMMLLFWLGSQWREDDQTSSNASTHAFPVPAPSPIKFAGFALAALLIAGSAPAWLNQLKYLNPTPLTLNLPNKMGDWTMSEDTVGLKPIFPGATATLMQEYRHGDQIVGLYLAFFRNQNRTAKAVSSENKLAAERSPGWNITGESEYTSTRKSTHFKQNDLTWGNQKLQAWQWYQIGDTQTASPYLAKWLQAKQRLTGHGDDILDVVIFAPYDKNSSEVSASMENFIEQTNAELKRIMQQASAGSR
jgi:exosortase A